jgi:hypothetical protein
MLGFSGVDGRGTSVTFPVIEGFRGRGAGTDSGRWCSGAARQRRRRLGHGRRMSGGWDWTGRKRKIKTLTESGRGR